jgi:hypothetical protein
MARRPGQQKGETAMEYLRRAVQNLNHEPESILDQLKSVDALLDYFDLWHKYGTDFWAGVLESITMGDNPRWALAFVKKHKLSKAWREDIKDAVKCSDDRVLATVRDPEFP